VIVAAAVPGGSCRGSVERRNVAMDAVPAQGASARPFPEHASKSACT